jgi:outer membrane lipoprotein-sorting protein
MVVSAKGLTQRRPLGREGEATVRKFRDRIFVLKYRNVPSRWTTGKDLKLDEVHGESWKLVESDATDRTDAQDEQAKDTLRKLKELSDKIDIELKRLPLPTPGKGEPKAQPKAGPDKSSAGPANGDMAAAARAQSAKLLAEVRAAAGRHKTTRATFTETLGAAEDHGRTVTGTVLVGPGGKMAIERIQSLPSGQTLKETRVFDGETLWAQTSAKDVGDVVRRWAAAGVKKEWRGIDGRPEVDFATLVNPARAWRLFGDDLAFLGTEQFEKEAAYVFEVRPDARYAALFGGPLAGDLIGLPAAKRFRFWIGVQSGFQIRLRAYDEQGTVLGVLECADVEPDAQVDPRRFAFQPPKGVEVTDMNAATAAAEK